MKKAKPSPVFVEWIDSIASSGWGDLPKPSDMRCASTGFLVAKTKTHVTLALNYCRHNKGYGHHIEIPACAVRRIVRLDSPKTRAALAKAGA